MSTQVNGGPQGDPLAGMEEGDIVLNDDLRKQSSAPEQDDEPPPAEDAEPEADAPEGEDAAGEDDAGDEDKPKKNKKPRDERIKELTREKKDLQRQLEDLKNGSLQSQIDEIKKLLTPPENSTTLEVSRDTAPDPNDSTKYRLGDLDPEYVKDLARWEVRSELAADRQRQADREAQAQREQQASEILSKVSDVADKGAALHEDYVETVVAPFLKGKLPLEEATFEAACETDHAAEILRELALNPAEAVRVASLSTYKQVIYVAERARHFAEQAKPRLPKAPPPPNNQARGTGGRFGIRGDTESLDDIEKYLYRG